MTRTTRAGWSKERPDEPGWWYWRLCPEFTPTIVELYKINKILMVPFRGGEWQSVPAPRE